MVKSSFVGHVTFYVVFSGTRRGRRRGRDESLCRPVSTVDTHTTLQYPFRSRLGCVPVTHDDVPRPLGVIARSQESQSLISVRRLVYTR